MEEILDRRAFAQEFRVGSDTEPGTGAAVCGKRALQFDSGTRGHRAFFHHQFWRARFGGNLLRYMIDGGKVGAAVVFRRRAHTDKNRIAKANRLARVGGVGNLSSFSGRSQNLVQVLLVDRHLAGFQLRDAPRINIRANHLVPGCSQARAGNQSHVAAANHR